MTFEEYESWSFALDEELKGSWASPMLGQAHSLSGDPDGVRSLVERLMLEGTGKDLCDALSITVHRLSFDGPAAIHT